MRTLLSLIIFALLSIPYTASAVEDDKRKHFWAAGLVATATYAGLRQHGHGRKVSYLGGFASAMIVGMLKELTDERIDKRDLEYDAMGALAVPLLVVAF